MIGDVPTTQCGSCGSGVPAGRFCGRCGAGLARRWRPSAPASLFPLLPRQSRPPLRMGLAVLVAVLAAFALLRWQAPLVGVAALGLPVLLAIYLVETDTFADLPVSWLTLSAALAVVLGVGWARLTGGVVTHAGTGVLTECAIPIAGAIIMVIPVTVLRLRRPANRESLAGFTIGMLGATCFTAAATLTHLAPQLEAGVVAHDRPVAGLIVEAGIRGVTVPVIAGAVGGMVGVALWFQRWSGATRRRWILPAIVAAGVLTSVGAYGVLGVIDGAVVPQRSQLGLYVIVMIVVLLGLRVTLRVAQRNEHRDETTVGHRRLCPQCHHVVPDMAFCPNCGVPEQASPESTVWPGYLVPADSYAAAPVRGTSVRRVVSVFGGALSVIAILVAALAYAITPSAPRYVCPPDCGRPPFGMPVHANPRFTAADGLFSVSYPGPQTAYQVTTESDGVTLDFTGGDGGTLRLFGQPAADRSPQQIADDLIKETFPDATTAYQIPNAMVGYQPGYGEFADVFPQGSSRDYARLRVVVLVAEKNGTALIATANGPFRQFGPDFGPGPPSAANLELALDMDQYVNSFRWRDDPPR
jgi:RNA polymerase subunit RPABC4/transcription elongation factor Spt4